MIEIYKPSFRYRTNEPDNDGFFSMLIRIGLVKSAKWSSFYGHYELIIDDDKRHQVFVLLDYLKAIRAREYAAGYRDGESMLRGIAEGRYTVEELSAINRAT